MSPNLAHILVLLGFLYAPSLVFGDCCAGTTTEGPDGQKTVLVDYTISGDAGDFDDRTYTGAAIPWKIVITDAATGAELVNKKLDPTIGHFVPEYMTYEEAFEKRYIDELPDPVPAPDIYDGVGGFYGQMGTHWLSGQFSVPEGHKVLAKITFDGDVRGLSCKLGLSWGCSDSFELIGRDQVTIPISPSCGDGHGQGSSSVGSASFSVGVGGRRALVYHQVALDKDSYSPARLSLPVAPKEVTEPVQYLVEGQSVSRESLTAPDGAVETIVDERGTIQQVRTLAGLTVVSELAAGDGFQISCYHGWRAKVNGLYLPSGDPFVVWTVENPDAGAIPPKSPSQLKITEARGTTAHVSHYAYAALPKASWSLWTDASPRIEAVTYSTDDSGTNKLTQIRDGTLLPGENLVSQSKEVRDAHGWVTRTSVGADDEEEWTDFTNDANGKVTLLTRSDGSYERRVTSPSGDTLAYSSLGDYGLDFSKSSQFRLRVESPHPNQLSDTTVTLMVGGQVYGSYESVRMINGWWTGRGAYGGTSSMVLNDPSAGFPSAGQPLAETSPDGSVTDYTYETGTYNPQTHVFSPGDGGVVRTNAHHSGTTTTPETWQRSVADEEGHSMLEETYYAQPGPGAAASRNAWMYDAQGNLTDALRQVSGGWRTTLHADWDQVEGRRTREVDETGVETLFTYPAPGVEVSTRSALPVAGSLPAIPAMTTTSSYDVEKRLVRQEMSTAGAVTQLHTWKYNTAGRVLEEATNRGSTTYAYHAAQNGAGRSVVETRPGGSTITTQYYLDGTVKSITGPSVISQSFAVSGLLGALATTTTRGDLTGEVNEITVRGVYDGGQTAFEQVPMGNETGGTSKLAYGYGWDGQLVSMTRDGVRVQTIANGVTTYHAGPDPDRRVTQQSSYVVDGTAAWLVYTDSRAGTTKEKVASFATNELSTVKRTDLLGAETVTVMTLDPAAHSTTTTTTFPLVGNPSVTISRAGMVQSIQTPEIAGATLITGDGFGREVSRFDPHTPNITTETAYNAYGQIASVNHGSDLSTMAYYAPGAPRGAGQLQSTTVNGSTTYYSYEAHGLLEHVWGATYPSWHEYDAVGRLSKLHTYRQEAANNGWFGPTWPADIGDAAGDVTTWAYYPHSEFLRQKLYASGMPGAIGKGPRYAWNGDGTVAKRIWARQVDGNPLTTTYSYNAQGDLRGMTYIDSTPSVSMSYDVTGRIAQVTDAGGEHHLSYDAAGHLTGEDGLASGGTMAYTFDRAGNLTGYSFQRANGQGALSTTYGFSGATGRLSTVTAAGRTVSYTYDPTTGWLSQTANFPLRTVRTPDAQGRLLSIATRNGDGAGPVLFASTYTYDAQGRRILLAREDGTAWHYGYNGRGEVVSGVNRYADGSPIPGMSYAYAYDPIGNRIGTVVNEASASYTTTPLNQYLSREVPPRVEVQGEISSQNSSRLVLGVNGQPVTLDGHGHFYETLPVNNSQGPRWQEVRIAAVRKGADAHEPDVADSSHGRVYLSQNPETFAYDLDGNLTSDGRWMYSWDAENRLIRVDTGAAAMAAGAPAARVEYIYGYRGRRLTKTESELSGNAWKEKASIAFAYADGWNLVAELDARLGNVLLRSYVWGLDLSGLRGGSGGVGGLLSLQVGGNVLLPASNGNGDVVGLADEAGVEMGRYAYGPFGEILRATGPRASANPLRFSTKYTDEQTGLIYYGCRYHQPLIGSWLSRDPMGVRGGMNPYGYLGNRSVDRVDPRGLMELKGHTAPMPAVVEVSRYTTFAKVAIESDQQGRIIERLKSERPDWQVLARPPLDGSFDIARYYVMPESTGAGLEGKLTTKVEAIGKFKWYQMVRTNRAYKRAAHEFADDASNLDPNERASAGDSEFEPPFYPAWDPPIFGDTSTRDYSYGDMTWNADTFLVDECVKRKIIFVYDGFQWGWRRVHGRREFIDQYRALFEGLFNGPEPE